MKMNQLIIKLQQNKMMQQSLLDRKNKQNFTKLNSIIHDYQTKLDNRVNQVVSQMINYTKKCSDPILLPVVNTKRNQASSTSKDNHRQRNKSMSFNTDISFLNETSLDSEMEPYRETFKNLESVKPIHQVGRPVGRQLFVKPKIIRKKPQILSKQARLDPFYERNAIKAHQLEKGLLNLMQKGKIGKDVNIITAFQKGRPVFQTQKAIFHQGEQRFADIENEKLELSKSRSKKQVNNNVPPKYNFKQKNFDESWALTMPNEQQGHNMSKQFMFRTQQKSKIQISFTEHIYIKLMSYRVVEDEIYKKFLLKNLNYKGQIVQIIKQINHLLSLYSIQIAYADGSKILNFVTKVSRLRKQQLIQCLLNKNNKLFSLKNVGSIYTQKSLSFDKITSCFKYYFQRKEFLIYLKKKKVAKKIYGWIISCITIKNRLQNTTKKRKQIEQKHSQIQKIFFQRYPKIQQQKHFQIHIVNEILAGKQTYKQYMNTQITRIFNIRNPHKHIIYILPFALDEETINYYYKIMELEEIPNYKERVTFIEVDPSFCFKQRLSISAKLFYNSPIIRKLKKKLKDFASYFVISYPSLVDIKLSVYLNIPIFGGDLHSALQIQKRTSLQSFKIDTLKRHIIENNHGSNNLTALSDDLIQYCSSQKRHKQYLVKIDGKNRSKGSALLTFPFSSLPQMYSNTNVVSQILSPDQFFHLLLKEGGIVEVYEEDIYPIVGVINISINGDISLIGSFQKISSGFVNIAYNFPQKKIDHKTFVDACRKVGIKLYQSNHFGDVEITFFVDGGKNLYLQKIQCYLTHLGSSLYYYKFLSEGELSSNGQYMAKIIDTFQKEQGGEEQLVSMEPRSFCFIPYLLHFGLSDRQANTFFQLCRMGGVSFDLENKYGATFILLGSLKTSMGLITTAKDKKGALKLMLKSLQFILKQNSHNLSNQTLIQKQIRMNQRQNIINIKQRLQQL